jgi:polar amino acid transport system substrate-binding protein
MFFRLNADFVRWMFRTLMACAGLCGLCHAAHATELEALTESLAPLSYEANGRVVGFSSELLDMMAAEARFTVKQQVLPWHRAYEMVGRQRNTLIYSLVRAPEREALFQWVGPISPRRMLLYKHRDRTDIAVKSLDDARAYRIGVTLESAAARSLTQQGFPRANNQQAQAPGLDLGLNDQMNLKKFMARRLDLLVMLDWAAMYSARVEGLDPEDLQPVLVLDDSNSYWYGVSLSTPPDVAVKLNAALQRIKSDGRYQQLKQKYLPKASR